MKHKSLTESQSAFDDSTFSLTDDQAGASFIPSLQPVTVAATAPSEIHSAAMPLAAPVGSMPAAISAQASFAGFTSVPISLGGITINLLFDAAAMAAPAGFRAGIEQAATLLAAAITDQITVNITVDISGTGDLAAAKPVDVHSLSYSTVRQDLIHFVSPNFNILPATSSIQGQSHINVYNAQEKLWGLLNPNDTTTADGATIFTTDLPMERLAGIALHELTHTLGRYTGTDSQPNVFDLSRFSSPGVRLFEPFNGPPNDPSYFSLDGGYSKEADYGQKDDPSDFDDHGVQGSLDPFNEHFNGSTQQFLSVVDTEQLDVLGFHVTPMLSVRVIENAGSTKLEQIGLYYYLDQMNTGVSPPSC